MINTKTFKVSTNILIENDKEIRKFMSELNIDKRTATWLLFEVLSISISFYHDSPKQLAKTREKWANLTPIISKLKEVNLYEVKNTKLQNLLNVLNSISEVV